VWADPPRKLPDLDNILRLSTFVELRSSLRCAMLLDDRLRLEDVGSGYWTLSILIVESASSAIAFNCVALRRPLDAIFFRLAQSIMSLIDSIPTGSRQALDDHRGC